MKRLWKRHHSIRNRIMLLFVLMTTFMLLAIWVVNNWFLERYYINQKLKVMELAYENINEAVIERVEAGENIADVISDEIAQEWESWGNSAHKRKRYPQDILPPTKAEEKTEEASTILETIRAFGDRNNVTIVLIDSTTGKTILNFGRVNDFLAQKVQRYVLGQGDNRSKILAEHPDYLVEMNYDFRSSNMYMESWGYFSDNQTLFIMSMPISSVRESVALSNRFVTYVGLVVLLFGSVLMYFVTSRVTKPIMKLSRLSERMSQLDFDVRYEDHADDEIGVLGNSMNTLSEKLKEAIEELKKANVQLQHDIEEKIKIDEMRKEFVANVSHELKTPIALIQGYAEGLAEGMCEDEESRNYYCEVIMDEASKMNQMVKQLLNLSALESGNDAPVMAVFDIHELIRDFVTSAGILVQQNDVQLEVYCEEPLYVLADEFKIEEVLTNYFNNAMNHLGGERKICIDTECMDDRVKVRVFNNGNPIPQEDLPNLWSKFYKVDKARTRAYGGSGIGLSIVKAIMDAHHQAYGVENKEDGVEFWFTLKMEKNITES